MRRHVYSGLRAGRDPEPPGLVLVVPGEEELGRQRLCPGCNEWWPWDREFWRIGPRPERGPWPQQKCHACHAEKEQRRARERRALERAAATAAVESAERAREEARRLYWRHMKALSRARAALDVA